MFNSIKCIFLFLELQLYDIRLIEKWWIFKTIDDYWIYYDEHYNSRYTPRVFVWPTTLVFVIEFTFSGWLDILNIIYINCFLFDHCIKEERLATPNLRTLFRQITKSKEFSDSSCISAYLPRMYFWHLHLNACQLNQNDNKPSHRSSTPCCALPTIVVSQQNDCNRSLHFIS